MFYNASTGPTMNDNYLGCLTARTENLSIESTTGGSITA